MYSLWRSKSAQWLCTRIFQDSKWLFRSKLLWWRLNLKQNKNKTINIKSLSFLYILWNLEISKFVLTTGLQNDVKMHFPFHVILLDPYKRRTLVPLRSQIVCVCVRVSFFFVIALVFSFWLRLCSSSFHALPQINPFSPQNCFFELCELEVLFQ